MSLKEISKKVLKKVKVKILNILSIIKKSFIKTTKGEEGLYSMLWFWGILPALFSFIYFGNTINRIRFKIISIPLYIAVIIYFLWHIISIRTTIKKHPEYQEKKEDKKKKYKGLSKDKIKELKQEERKEKNRDILKKAMLLKAWDSTPFYKIVILIDCFIILTQIQKILYIL